MYIVQSDACSVQNSRTPVSAADIAAGQAALAAINVPADNAQAIFTSLVNRTDLNTNGWPLATMGGTPAGPAGGGGANAIGGSSTGLKTWPKNKGRVGCIVMARQPQGAAPTTVAAYAAPPAPKMPSLVTQGHPTSKPSNVAKTIPTTGNVCKDLILGWALQSQVTTEQLVACANAGYSGVLGTAPGIVALQNALMAQAKLPKIAFQTPPAQTNPPWNGSAELAQSEKQYGMGCASTCDFLTGMISALGLAAAGLYVFDYLKRSGRVSF